MFKFWKSPKPSSVSPTASGTKDSTPQGSVNNSNGSSLPATAATSTPENVGLGFDMSGFEADGKKGGVSTGQRGGEGGGGGGEGEAARRVRYPLDGTLTVPEKGEKKVVGGRRSSTSQVAFVLEEEGDSATSKPTTEHSSHRIHSQPSNRMGTVGSKVRLERSTSPIHRNVSREEGTAIRSVSPLSFSPSIASTFHNPYGASVAALTERDPNQIYAPTTWSDMAHQELVVNVSARERTRQEILWEVVASEERYVVELRSLVEQYANPLLHPLLSSPTPFSSPALGGSSPQFSRESTPAASSSSDLPIAARFLRSTPSTLSSSTVDQIPEIRTGSPHLHPRVSVSTLPSRSPAHHSNPNSSSDAKDRSSSSTGGVTGRLASFAFGRSRQSSSSTAPKTKASKSNVSSQEDDSDDGVPPQLPEALRMVLESTVEMLKGHEELSLRLKDQWTKAFPLVRGLAAIWSDQSWFLQTYTTYIVSLEEALSLIDTHLPSSHPTASHNPLRLRSSASTRQSPSTPDQRLTRTLLRLEREAAEAGESSLSICLSKPLMRLSKLPLLMQALLFHTDPTTHEWEKTRAMALEVDALVRSIEDEKIEEDSRERTRDVLARIDGINDRGLMMPRSPRILISESPAPPSTASTLPSRRPSTKRSSRRISSGGTTGTFGRSKKAEQEWLIKFTDVVIRAMKTGETNIPGSFSREKEKLGKQGKPKKTGPVRNTYRFLRVERWEHPTAAAAALVAATEDKPDETGKVESDADEDTVEYAESRMSFRFDAEEPQPTTPRDFTAKPTSRPKTTVPPRRGVSSSTPANAKFGSRLRQTGSEGVSGIRLSTPTYRHRFDSPTLSSSRKVSATPTVAPPASTAPEKKALVGEKVIRSPLSTTVAPSTTIASHARDESTYNLYRMWSTSTATTQD